MVVDYAARNKKRMRAQYKETQAAESAEKKARKEREKTKKTEDKRQTEVDLAEEKIRSRAANAARVEEEKQAKREELQKRRHRLKLELEQEGLEGTEEASLRNAILTAEFSRDKQCKMKGMYAQMCLDEMRNEQRASERRARAERGEFSAGV